MYVYSANESEHLTLREVEKKVISRFLPLWCMFISNSQKTSHLKKETNSKMVTSSKCVDSLKRH